MGGLPGSKRPRPADTTASSGPSGGIIHGRGPDLRQEGGVELSSSGEDDGTEAASGEDEGHGVDDHEDDDGDDDDDDDSDDLEPVKVPALQDSLSAAAGKHVESISDASGQGEIEIDI